MKNENDHILFQSRRSTPFKEGLPARHVATNQSKLERIIGICFSILIPLIFKTWQTVAVGIFLGSIFIIPKRYWERCAAIFVILFFMFYKKMFMKPKKKVGN